MKVSTKAACVRHAASKTRYGQNCVLVEEDGSLVATNGHWLLRARANGAEAGERTCLGLDTLEREHKVSKARKADTVEIEPCDNPKPESFPDWRPRVPAPLGNLPVADDAKTVTLDVKYLEALLKAAREFHGGKRSDTLLVKFTLQNGIDPVSVEVQTPDSGELSGVLMPVRP